MARTSTYPPGWDEQRVREVLAHYEEQGEDEAVAEDEASFGRHTKTTVEVPHELLPAVRDLIAAHARNHLEDGSSRPPKEQSE
jgi:hypothetical protein